MHTKTVEKVVKSSIVYGYAVTQPFLIHGQSIQAPSEEQPLKPAVNNESALNIPLKTKPHHHIKQPYKLQHTDITQGIQSSDEVIITNDIEKKKMQENYREEKKRHFKKIASEIHSISYGETSKKVKKAQKLLAKYDYYEGEIDSIYGPLTEEALQKAKTDQILPQAPTPTIEQTSQTTSAPEDSNVNEKTPTDKEISQTITTTSSHDANIIQQAKNFMGTPYVWGGVSESGFDCSGFIQFVYQEENITIPRTVSEIWNFGGAIEQPSIGGLVFFETYKAGPSHVGIYLGDGNFIHAGVTHGVTISNFKKENYWKQRYLGAKKIK